MFGGHRLVEIINNLASLLRDFREHLPAIVGVAGSGNELQQLHSIEEPGDVGHARQQPIAQLVAAQPFRLGAPQYAQHIVLRVADTIRLEQLLEGVLQQRLRAHDAEMRFLLQTGKRFSLPKLGLQILAHPMYLGVITLNVNTRIFETAEL